MELDVYDPEFDCVEEEYEPLDRNDPEWFSDPDDLYDRRDY